MITINNMYYYSVCLLLSLLFINNIKAQTFNDKDTIKVDISPQKSPFGVLSIPNELLNNSIEKDINMRTSLPKLSLYKDFSEEYFKYGLAKPNINLHLNYYNPQKKLNPALYALLLVGAFFNNRVTTIQEEQYNKIMNDIYGYPSSSSRYGLMQMNIQKGVFGRPDIVVSGYKTFVPETNNRYNNIIQEEMKPTTLHK